MKTTVFILGVLGLFTFTSCRCNIDEDEDRNRDQKNKAAAAGKAGMPESDTLSIR
ncbi:hypothetical protein ACP3T3_03760 [Chryseobacterium sp. CBSDS_008]|uniref:hypothetical protein n=1 Tax=Chryseobacterium sp. CBSDS_008 TaxID=3415265 RepID=UPI003CEE0327